MASPFNVFRSNLKPLMVALTLLALLGFVVLPAVQMYQQSNLPAASDLTVATYNGGKFETDEIDYYQRLHGQTNRFLAEVAEQVIAAGGTPRVPNFGTNGSRQMSYGISPVSSPGMAVMTKLYAAKATELGMELDDTAIRNWLDLFTDGKLSMNQLAAIRSQSSQNTLGEAQMYSLLRTELLANLYDRMMTAGLTTGRELLNSPLVTWNNFLKINQQAQATAYPVLVEEFIDQAPEPSAATIEKLYEEGKSRFPNPNSPDPGFRKLYAADIEYVAAHLEDFVDREVAKISEEALKAEYERRVAGGDFTMPALDFEQPDLGIPSESDSNPTPDSPVTESPEAMDATETPAVQPTDTPASETPSTESPAVDSPASDPTITEPPATEPAVTEPAVTEPPATDPPATEPPATEPPATDPPATEPAATEPAATEPPATEPPATDPPATDPPATDPPATDPPATEPPATEPPATEPPATDPPATDPPVVDPPVTDPPATEPPPVEEVEPQDEPNLNDGPSAGDGDQAGNDNPQASSQMVDTSVRLVFTAAQEETQEPTSDGTGEQPTDGQTPNEQPAGEQPTGEQPPAGDTPADPAVPAEPADTPIEQQAPEEEPAKPSGPKPFEEVRDQIARDLAMPTAVKLYQDSISQAYDLMKDYLIELAVWESDKEGDKPTPPDLKKLAGQFGLRYETTGTVTALDVNETTLGRAQIGTAGAGASFTNVMFNDSRPVYAAVRAENRSDLAGQVAFSAWKTEAREGYIPKLEEIRNEVIAAAKLQTARELAEAKAKELAEQANANPDKPLVELVPETRKTLVFEDLGPFPWMMSFGFQFGPMMGNVSELDNVGEEFMKTVFTGPVGQYRVGPNIPKSVYYVVKATEVTPPAEELRARFMQANQRALAEPLSVDDVSGIRRSAAESFEKAIGLEFNEEAFSGR